MRSSQEIQENIAELRDELDAIVAIAEREEREQTEDEQARLTAITSELIPKLNKQYKTSVAVEKERLMRSAKRFEEAIDAQFQEHSEINGVSPQPAGRFGGIKVPAKAKSHSELRAYKGPDAEHDAYIAGQVVLAGIYGNESAIQFCRNHGLYQASMTTGENGSGGFLTPDEMQRTLVRLREQLGVFPQYANRVPMGADIMTVPRLLSDVTAYWTGEGSEIQESDATLGGAEAMARKLAALTKVSSELDEDAVVDIGDMITMSMAYAMSHEIDDAAFNGDGTSTYGGVLGLKNALHANATHTALAGNDAPINLDIEDFLGAIGKFPQYGGAAPRWFMHSAVFYAACARLETAAGGNTTSTIKDGVSTNMFLGYPVTFTNVMHHTITTSPSTIVAYFGDLRLGCTYGTRRSLRTEVSRDRYFENDLIGIKTTERVAILCHERGDTIRTRPIIALKTAS